MNASAVSSTFSERALWRPISEAEVSALEGVPAACVKLRHMSGRVA